MKQNNKLKFNKKRIVIFILIIIVAAVMGFSFAYFSAIIRGNETSRDVNTQLGDRPTIELDGTTIIDLGEVFPGDSKSINFSVKNLGSATAVYNLDIINVVNTFVDTSDLVYTITSTNSGGTKSQSEAPLDTTRLINDITIEGGQTQEYTMTFTFLETNDSQNDNAIATFSGKIQINNLQDDFFAQHIIASNNLITSSPNFDIGEPPSRAINTGSGLYVAQDDLGTSYYFRGAINNNYVSFAGYTWKIVRINGDNSIRMILAESTGTNSAFNSLSNAHKYVGYTYDNDSACTVSSPCISTYDSNTKKFINNKKVTNSTIKDYLENIWYQEIASYDNYISLGGFCNDTSSDAPSSWTSIAYPAYFRIKEDFKPTLKCPNTSNDYGGYYVSKIGLLSADEINMAGYSNSGGTSEDNYLYIENSWWSLSPYKIYQNTPSLFVGYFGYINTESDTKSLEAVYPVINLRADVTVSSGDGTESNPYVIDTN